MHSYLKSIGFRQINKNLQEKQLIRHIIANPDSLRIIQTEADSSIAIYKKEIAANMGIDVYGEYDEKDIFQPNFYFPYIKSQIISSSSSCEINKRIEQDSYLGICEDYRIGMSLIFHLLNIDEMLEARFPKVKSIKLSGLASTGRIYIPLQTSSVKKMAAKNNAQKRHNLMAAAKDGDVDAIETLTWDDMTIYSQITRRIKAEDLYSIIDSFFMPNGLECDQYMIMGDILAVEQLTNNMTNELIFKLELECNDIPLTVAINEKDLLGEPIVGRRFKGEIWLQGTANI